MELEYSLDSENGFDELFDVIEADTEQEKTRTGIEIYKRVENKAQTKEDAELLKVMAGGFRNMETLGNVLASHYAGLVESFEDESMIEDGFYDQKVEYRLNSIDELTEEEFNEPIGPFN